MPNLVPPDKLEQANQLSLFTTYGTAPVAGLLFSLICPDQPVPRLAVSHYFTAQPVDLALYFNVLTFVVSALTVDVAASCRAATPPRRCRGTRRRRCCESIWDGWRFVGQNRIVRGIVIGMSGAFAAGGVVVGLGAPYVKTMLHGGGAGWGVVFAAIFLGLAAGMFLGLRILRGFTRHRLFGLSIAFAALPLALIALIPNLVIVAILVLILGACAGVAYVTGYTVDRPRGR